MVVEEKEYRCRVNVVPAEPAVGSADAHTEHRIADLFSLRSAGDGTWHAEIQPEGGERDAKGVMGRFG